MQMRLTTFHDRRWCQREGWSCHRPIRRTGKEVGGVVSLDFLNRMQLLSPTAERLGRAGGGMSSTLRLVGSARNGDGLGTSRFIRVVQGCILVGIATLLTKRRSWGREMTLEVLSSRRERFHRKLQRSVRSTEDKERGRPTIPGRLGEGSKPRSTGERFCGMAEPYLAVVEAVLTVEPSLARCCLQRRSISEAGRPAC